LVGAWAVFVAPSQAWANSAQRPYPGDLGQAVASLLIFLGLATVLGKYAWRPVIANLRRRDEDIAKRLSDAQAKQAQADEAVAQYRQQMENIQIRAEQLHIQAKRDAAIEAAKILNLARDEARKIAAQAEENIATAQSQARRDMQAETADLAAKIAGQFLQDKLSADDHSRLVTQAAEQLGDRAGGDL
jgi:F-type H+-transporting ATPase subunit b